MPAFELNVLAPTRATVPSADNATPEPAELLPAETRPCMFSSFVPILSHLDIPEFHTYALAIPMFVLKVYAPTRAMVPLAERATDHPARFVANPIMSVSLEPILSHVTVP